MPTTFDLMLRLHPPKNFIGEFPPPQELLADHPRTPLTAYRLHVALVLMKNLGLLQYEACMLDPTNEWQIYLKTTNLLHCENTYITLRFLDAPVPTYEWHSLPLVN